jgi:paraquat-inducible protein A
MDAVMSGRYDIDHDEGNERIAICDQCDAVQRVSLNASHWRCFRCRAHHHRHASSNPFALRAWSYTGLICLFVSLSFPIISIRALGSTYHASLASMTWGLWQSDRRLLATVVALTTIVIPLAELLCIAFLATPAAQRRSIKAAVAGPCVTLVESLRPWNLLQVMTLGVLVAVARLGALVTILPGLALIGFVGMIVSFAMLSSRFDASAYGLGVQR